VAIEVENVLFTTNEKDILSVGKVISEMKQTAALMLGILRLGAIFVQMNALMV